MAKRQDELSTTLLWQDYERSLNHSARVGLGEQVKKNIDFFEGRQWASPTESTKNLPRPVVNVIKMICRSKKAAILSSPLQVKYKSYTQGIDVSRLNSFASGLFSELGQNALDRLAIDDAIKKGSCFLHYYWDKDVVSLSGKQDGSVRGEIIDPLCIFFENPAELNEQKQKWIIILSKIAPSEVASICDSDLVPASYDSDLDENGSVTVLTRYFRRDNAVYFEKCTKTHVLTRAKRLIPSSAAFCASLYPVVCGYYEKKEGSLYGISEIEGLIPNQKAINFNIAMSLLNAQECAWGKYVALPGALKGQKISNVPGQVLIDHTGTGQGIVRMDKSEISQVPMQLSEALIQITRSISGATELLSGEALTNNLSGTAIAQLQAQAQLPIEDLKSEFIEFKRKQGLVIAQFIRHYFYGKEFILTSASENGPCEIIDAFYSSDYEHSVLDVVVEVTNSSKATVASDISLLNTCLEKGNISLEAYIKAYPDCAISNKNELLALIKAHSGAKSEEK